MNKKSLQNKVLSIKWDDSRLYITQMGKDCVEDPCIVESVGFCILDKRTELTGNLRGSIVLAGDEVDGEFRRTIVIPQANILSIDILSQGK